MKDRRKHHLSILSLLVLILAIPACGKRASPTELPRRQEIAPPPQRDVETNGSLEEINGVRVLRVWGSPQEMGFAQGYLLADDLMDLFEHVLFGTLLANFPKQWTYEQVVSVIEEQIVWPEGYREEMEAIIHGMEAALGELPEITHERIAAGSVVVNADMVAILNAHTDLVDLPRDCCSFAAWGAATGDGQTRAGGNQQGPWGPLHDYALLMVRQPSDGLSTACSNIPGSLTCMRGFNETGVVMMPQGAKTPWIEVDGLCYAGMHGRLVLEQVAAGPDMVSQVAEVFETYPRCGSSIFLFAQGTPAWSDPSVDQRAVVIEHDYTGVTVRLPSHNALPGTPLTEAIVATNRFLQRKPPASHPTMGESDRRYDAMVAVLQKGVNDLMDMQEVLIACDPGGVAQQSVYVEPDTMTIHVAFRPGAKAPHSAAQTPVSFTWEELFAPLGE
jgi:hypothetical protein